MYSVNSPCNGRCRLDTHSGWCDGCLRTAQEISAWCDMPDERRRELLALLEQRQLGLRTYDQAI